MSDTTPVTCPQCGFLTGARHECATRIEDGQLLRSTTDVTIGDVTAPIEITLDNRALGRVREIYRQRRRFSR